jgi:hypothetical protein
MPNLLDLPTVPLTELPAGHTKHLQIVSQVLRSLRQLGADRAVKIDLRVAGRPKKADLRTALHRAAKKEGLELATASDHKFVCLSSKRQSRHHSNRRASSYCSRVRFNIIFDSSSIICPRRSSRSSWDARLVLWLPSLRFEYEAFICRRSRISCVKKATRSEMSLYSIRKSHTGIVSGCLSDSRTRDRQQERLTVSQSPNSEPLRVVACRAQGGYARPERRTIALDMVQRQESLPLSSKHGRLCLASWVPKLRKLAQ